VGATVFAVVFRGGVGVGNVVGGLNNNRRALCAFVVVSLGGVLAFNVRGLFGGGTYGEVRGSFWSVFDEGLLRDGVGFVWVGWGGRGDRGGSSGCLTLVKGSVGGIVNLFCLRGVEAGGGGGKRGFKKRGNGGVFSAGRCFGGACLRV